MKMGICSLEIIEVELGHPKKALKMLLWYA